MSTWRWRNPLKRLVEKLQKPGENDETDTESETEGTGVLLVMCPKFMLESVLQIAPKNLCIIEFAYTGFF